MDPRLTDVKCVVCMMWYVLRAKSLAVYVCEHSCACICMYSIVFARLGTQ